jgi:hypothetical protein
VVSYGVGWWLCSHIIYFILENYPGSIFNDEFKRDNLASAIFFGLIWGIAIPVMILYHLIINFPQYIITWINKVIIRKKS